MNVRIRFFGSQETRSIRGRRGLGDLGRKTVSWRSKMNGKPVVWKWWSQAPCVHARSITSVVSDSLQPHGSHGALRTRLPCPCGFSRQAYWNGLPCPPRGSSQPRDRTQVPGVSSTAGEFFTSEPQRMTLRHHASFQNPKGVPGRNFKLERGE